MSYGQEISPIISGTNTSNLVDYYRGLNTEVLADLIITEHTGWNERVDDVYVVLCASRSGSSLIFNALASSGKVAAPGGEHEPWLTLTENKFPLLDSDEFGGVVNNKDLLGHARELQTISCR